MKIWIDTVTGAYGNLAELKVVELSDAQLAQWDAGVSDSTIAEYGLTHGVAI